MGFSLLRIERDMLRSWADQHQQQRLWRTVSIPAWPEVAALISLSIQQDTPLILKECPTPLPLFLRLTPELISCKYKNLALCSQTRWILILAWPLIP